MKDSTKENIICVLGGIFIAAIIISGFYSLVVIREDTSKELVKALETVGYSNVTIESSFTSCGILTNKNSMGWEWKAEDILGNPASGTACRAQPFLELQIKHNNKGG